MKRYLDFAARAVAVVILAQTLFFKFSAAPESVYIFTALGLEPWGRILAGVAELVACILLVVPGTVALGALLGVFTMTGALVSHLTKLGIAVQNDGGLLFFLALVVLACCAFSLWFHRRELSPISVRLWRHHS